MTNEVTVNCPSCNTKIKVTESLAAPMIEAMRQKLARELQEKNKELEERESSLGEREKVLLRDKQSVDVVVNQKLESAKPALTAELTAKARLAVADDLAKKDRDLIDLHEVIKERDKKLTEAQKAEADFLRKQRELDDTIRSTEVSIEKRVQEALSDVRIKARRESEEEMKLKVREKEQLILSMQTQIDELKRRSDPTSAQLQGDAQEVELETILKMRFIQDTIERIAKGEPGADLLQTILRTTGQSCGTILWESKRTKHWSDMWLAKLRADAREVGANVACIVSSALPKGVETFDLVDGVWVISPRFVIPIAIVLRQSLIEISSARVASEGQQTKMELLYQYLVGPGFRRRVDAIVEKFGDMQLDLYKERKAMTRLWAKREMQIQSVLEATAGMYGDLQGIAGKTLPEIEGLQLLGSAGEAPASDESPEEDAA